MRRQATITVEKAIEVLQVAGSSKEAIKAAYRKAAMLHHPDKGGDPAKFKEAKEAYDVLMQNVGTFQVKVAGPAGPTMGDKFVDFVAGGGPDFGVFNAYGKHTSPLYEVTRYCEKLGVTLSVTMVGDVFTITHIKDVKLPMPISLGTTVEQAKAAIDEIAKQQTEHRKKY